MNFALLGKFRERPTKEMISRHQKFVEQKAAEGVKWIETFWTLGLYDAVAIIEAPDEKEAMKLAIRRDYMDSVTLVASRRWRPESSSSSLHCTALSSVRRSARAQMLTGARTWTLSLDQRQPGSAAQDLVHGRDLEERLIAINTWMAIYL